MQRLDSDVLALSAEECRMLAPVVAHAATVERSTPLARLALAFKAAAEVGTPIVPERCAADVEEFTVAECARRLGIAERTVRQRCATGRLDASKRLGRWMIRSS